MTSTTSGWRIPVTQALVCAIFCGIVAVSIGFFELLSAAYSGPWLGGTNEQWFSWIKFLLAYSAFIAIVASLPLIAFRRLFPRATWRVLAMVAFSMSGCILALFLVAVSDTLSWPESVAVVLLPIAILVYVLLARTWHNFSDSTACALLLLSFGSGILAVRGAFSLQYFMRDTTGVVALLAALDCLAVLALTSLQMFVLSGRAAARRVRPVAVIATVFALPVLLFAWPHFVRAPNGPKNAPNVLLITADALRADYCSTFGGRVPTPNLTRLAQRGVRFDTCYSTAPWTIPALNAMFSAKYAPGLSPRVDVKEREQEQMAYQKLAAYWLDPDGSGMIGRFAGRGYATAAFCGNGTMCEQNWLLDQFDHATVVNPRRLWAATQLRLNPLADRCIRALFPGVLKDGPLDTTAVAKRFAADYLYTHFSKTFFLWVHFLDPHTPYDPPARYRVGSAPANGWFIGDGLSAGIDRELTHEEAGALYEGEIEYLDEAVGHILDVLQRLGLDDDTYVCFSADHGEELWDRGQHGHGHSMLNEVVGVPFIFTGPDITQRVVTQPVSTISVMPTLLDLADISGPGTHQDLSLKPALWGKHCDALNAPCYALATHEFWPKTEPQQMVRHGQYKYVRWLVSGKRLLFDEIGDARELFDIAEQKPDVAARLDARLDAWERTFPCDFAAAQQSYGQFSLTPPSAELRENLEALGYL